MKMQYILLQAGTPKSPQGAGEEPSQPPSYHIFIMLGVMFLIFWFLLIRPQRKEQKKKQEMVDKLKKNDHVLTSGGIFGIVHSVKDNEVVLKIDEQGNVKVKFAKSAIATIIKQSADEVAQLQTTTEGKK